MRRSSAARLALLLFALGCAAPPAQGAGPRALGVLDARLPERPFPRLAGGGTSRPDEALRGKPALLLFADADAAVPAQVVAALEALQAEFAPWLRWGGVVVGLDAAGPGALAGTDGRFRLDASWSDRDGSWRSAFRVNELPAVVLVTEEGYVARRFAGARAADAEALRAGVERLVGAGKLRGRAALDFKLEEAGTGRLLTLADVVTREFTLLFSLRADCDSCFEQLALLERIRDGRPGRVTLVAIDHEPDGAVPAPADGRLRADFVLRDPALRYAERYPLGGVPALVVVDGGGRVVLARQGFLPDEVPALAEQLLQTIDGRPAPGGEQEGFLEALRVRAEGLALLEGGRPGLAAFFFERALELCPELYTVQALLADAHHAAGSPREAALAYGRYLAADPLPCDRERIARQIGLLAAGQ